jgi:hypothetical protein
VALGAPLTGGFGLFADRHRRRADAAMARRLVYADLRTIDRALTDAESNFRRSEERPPDPGQQWRFGWEREAWSQSWAGYRGILAANLDDAEFEPLATAFGFVEQLQNSLAAGRPPFQDADATFLQDGRRSTRRCGSCRRGRRATDRERSRGDRTRTCNPRWRRAQILTDRRSKRWITPVLPLVGSG